MANFLLFTETAAGHVAPALPISSALVEHGHQVTWITGRVFKDRVEATGAIYIPTPEELDPGELAGHDIFPELRKLKGAAQLKWYYKHVYLDHVIDHLEAIDSALERFPSDVLIGDSVMLGVYFKSELSNLPSAMISIGPLGVPSRDVPPFGLALLPGKGPIIRARDRILNWISDKVILGDLNTYSNKIRRQLGLASKASFVRALFEAPTLVLQPSTPAFEYPRSDLPKNLHFIGPILPKCDPAFSPPDWWTDLRSERPVILINQGTIAKNPNDLIFPAIEGLRDQNMLVVAVPVDDQGLDNLPQNVRAEKFIPFAHLLPFVTVMVTNGGYGSVHMALAHGVPLVVAGATEDKMEVAARVEWSGAGINLRTQYPSPEKIREAAREVLSNPTYRENAQRIQRDFSCYHAPEKAAELLGALAERA